MDGLRYAISHNRLMVKDYILKLKWKHAICIMWQTAGEKQTTLVLLFFVENGTKVIPLSAP